MNALPQSAQPVQSSPSRAPNVWVVRHGPEFSVKLEGNATPLVAPTAQRTAVTIARLMAIVNRSELVVQGWSGRIQRRDRHGRDPVEARG